MTATRPGEAGTDSTQRILAWSRELVQPALRAVAADLPSSMRHIVAYHFGWQDEYGRPNIADGGKALRPTLVLLAADAVGGTAREAVPAAVAVELVHNFSLLHDDVMDGDTTRRHRRTAWTVFGTDSAILAGDLLLTTATDTLIAGGADVAADATRMLNEAVAALIHGQSIDLSLQEQTAVDVDQCRRMAAAKTGALLGCACALGAAFGGADAERIRHLRAFGEHLGLAFQHVDDLLGIWGDPDVTGKPVHSDLRTRKKSLPVVAALNADNPAARELAELYRAERLSERDIARAAELVALAGGRDWSTREADTSLQRALDELDSAVAEPRRSQELVAMARLVTRRDH